MGHVGPEEPVRWVKFWTDQILANKSSKFSLNNHRACSVITVCLLLPSSVLVTEQLPDIPAHLLPSWRWLHSSYLTFLLILCLAAFLLTLLHLHHHQLRIWLKIIYLSTYLVQAVVMGTLLPTRLCLIL